MNAATTNAKKSPCVIPPAPILLAAVPNQADDGDAAEELHQRRQHRHRARHFQVGAVQAVATPAEIGRLVLLGAKRLHDPVAGEGFDRDVREVGELLLAPRRLVRRTRCPSRTSG